VGALDTAGVPLEVVKLDLVGVLIVGVRGVMGFPDFCIDATVGVGRDGSSASSEEVGSGSGAISAGTIEMSFLQFSKKELGASTACLCNAFVVKDTSGSVCDKGSPCLTWLLTEAEGVDGDGSDIGWEPSEGGT
jgi:hypothetical protein